MEADLHGLVPLDRSLFERAVMVLTRAFWDYPASIFMFPDEQVRAKMLPHIHRTFLFYNARYGEMYTTSRNLEGIAIWTPSENYPITFWRAIRSMPITTVLGAGRANRVGHTRRIGRYEDRLHREHAPFEHWYLQAIAVDPACQKQGYAGALLRPMLTRIDKHGLPCYLETAKQTNVPLYEHFGFRVVSESAIPNTNLTNWAMLRTASGN